MNSTLLGTLDCRLLKNRMFSRPRRVAPRRPGDPPALVADGSKAARELDWKPRFDTLRAVVETAWAWHRAHPRGFGEPRR